MRMTIAWAATAIVAFLMLVYPAGGEQVVRYRDAAGTGVPPLTLQLGFGGTVLPVALDWRHIATPRPAKNATPCANGASDPRACTDFVLVSLLTEANGNKLKIGANATGLNVTFFAVLPFVTAKTMNCTALRAGGGAALITIIARSGEPGDGDIAYDGGRAECDIGPGFAYAVSAEKQSLTNMVPAGAGGAEVARTLTIPWKLLALSTRTTRIMVAANMCTAPAGCKTYQEAIEIPVTIVDTGAAVSLQYTPYFRGSGPTPAPGSTPLRLHQLGFDGSYGWDHHDLLMATFAQDQSTVTAQRALAQAISLTPLALPTADAQMAIAQTLQTRSQPLLAFAQPDQRLSDDSLKPLFDLNPFSVSKLGSFSSGYTYGYDAQSFKFAAMYGALFPGSYAGAETLTVAFATPVPSPEPTFTRGVRPRAAVVVLPLKAPPPPAPFFESGTANDLPGGLVLQHGYVGSKGGHDVVDALSASGHVYTNASLDYGRYQAVTVDAFGRVMRDFANPSGTLLTSSSSQFAGESASFTSASATSAHPTYFQLKETVAAQADDNFFAPSAGSITWVTALNGPIGHLTAAFAGGEGARYYALDLEGFRLTNTFGDVATQAGWQVTIPMPTLLNGWIFTTGSLTQTVSDRVAVLEQGLVSNYATAISEVIPVPLAKGAVPASPIRPQYLGNASLLSPWIKLTWPANVQLQVTGGYNVGSVTGCATAPNSTAKQTFFACQTQRANHAVGGVFFKVAPNWSFGATDTSALPGSISAGGAARNLGTGGALPGSVTGFLSYGGCPKVQVAYTNAAFPPGVPLPQQGNTLSGELDYPLVLGNLQFDTAVGYFNEHPVPNSGPSSSGAFLALRLTALRPKPTPC